MYSKYELEKNRKLYYSLIDNLSSIIKYIDDCIENLNQSLIKFCEAFNIDGMSADNNKLSNCNKTLIDRRNALKNVIIPAINEEINRINMQIAQLEAAYEENTASNNNNNNSSNNSSSSSNNSNSNGTTKNGNNSRSNNVRNNRFNNKIEIK